MPIIKIKTLESKAGWTNPDNADMVSYDVVVDVNGRKAQARTFSKAISEVGFEGEVETYEKKDHTYLKQVQREGSSWGGKKSFGNKPSYKDNSDGQRQGMCINNAANYVNSQDKDYTPVEWADRVWRYANTLYELGDLGKKQEEVKDEVDQAFDDEGQLDLSLVEDIFGKDKPHNQ